MIPIPLNLLGPIAGLLVFVGLLGGAYWKGREDANTKWELEVAQSKATARETEAGWRAVLDQVRSDHAKEKGVIQSNLTTALNGLRDRPTTRLPEPARAACVGATGAELSRGDAEFLVWLASDAAQAQSALAACKGYIDTVRAKK